MRLVTSYESRIISENEMLQLIVPGEFANPSMSREGSKPSVTYFDFVEWRRRTRAFNNREEAGKFLIECKSLLDVCTRLRNVIAKDIVSRMDHFAKYYRIPMKSVHYEARPVPIDPTWIGLWLGDGTSRGCHITTTDSAILTYITTYAATHGLVVKPDASGITYTICSGGIGGRVDRSKVLNAMMDFDNGMPTSQIYKKHHVCSGTLKKYIVMRGQGTLDKHFEEFKENPIWSAMKTLGLDNNKHIPDVYKHNSREVRLCVLGGLIDTDGSLNSGGYDMCFASQRMAEDIAEVARSLGYMVRPVAQCEKTCTNAAGGPKKCIAFRFRIAGGNELRDIPLLLDYKRLKIRKQRFDQLKFSIET